MKKKFYMDSCATAQRKSPTPPTQPTQSVLFVLLYKSNHQDVAIYTSVPAGVRLGQISFTVDAILYFLKRLFGLVSFCCFELRHSITLATLKRRGGDQINSK